MGDERLLGTKESAPWLPQGSAAEVWVGRDCPVPDPCIIVRLLLLRATEGRATQFFCVPTPRGLDLPSVPLGASAAALTPGDGLAVLAESTLGRSDVAVRCVGYIRNVVPEPDETYSHPVPYAHVPVFAATQPVGPVVTGSWVAVDAARADLSGRHWWPIVETYLVRSTR